MKVLVVSGFLGAGKTTFIEHIIKYIKGSVAILENEYGQQGVDGTLFESKEINVWELTEGCICCSMNKDFAQSVLTIANTVEPDFLIVEPTGVGKLSAVMANLTKIKYERIELLSPITIVDPTVLEETERSYGQIFKDQIINAGIVLVSKVCQASAQDVEKAVKRIENLNKNVEILSENFDNIDEENVDKMISTFWNDSSICVSTAGLPLQIDSFSISDVSFKSLEIFTTYMSAVAEGRFGNVARVKGILRIQDVWTKVDMVGKNFTMETFDDSLLKKELEAKLVIIGKGLMKEELRMLFGN